MNWAYMPYFRIAFMFILGIGSFSYFNFPNKVFLGGLSFSLGLYLLSEYKDYKSYISYKPFISGGLLLLFFYFLGAILYAHKAHSVNLLKDKNLDLSKVQFTGTVRENMKSNFGPKYLLQLDQVRDYSGVPLEHNRPFVMVHFHQSDSCAYAYSVGDKIVCRGEITKIKSNTNPEAFDYAQYLYFKSILYSSKVSLANHYKMSSGGLGGLSLIANNIKSFGHETLDKYMKPSLEKGVLEALILGQRIHLDPHVYKNYANTGAVHVLAVSGLHVGIFISVFIAFFSRVNNQSSLWKVLKVLMLGTLILLYVLVTGASPSVIRAGTMVSLYILGQTYFNKVSPYNIISVAAILMLMWNPFMLFQTSFQFSFLALLSILYFHKPIFVFFQPSSRLLRFLWGIVSVSIAAQIFIFPFTIYYFHQFPVYFAVSSLLAIPLVTVVIYLGMLMMVSELVLSSINPILAKGLEGIIGFLNASIHTISQWPLSLLENIWLSDVSLFLCVVTFLAGIFWWENRKLWSLYLTLLGLLGIVIDESFRTLDSLQSKQLTVYDTFRGTIVDVKNQKEHQTYRNSDTLSREEDFAAKNNRIKNQFVVKAAKDKGLFRLGTELIYVYKDDEDFYRLKDRLNITTLIVTNELRKPPEAVLSKINPKWVILEKQLKPWLREKWLNLRLDQDVKVFDIKSQGAYSRVFK